jgi:hypothetical protein
MSGVFREKFLCSGEFRTFRVSILPYRKKFTIAFCSRSVVAHGLGRSRKPKDRLWTIWCSLQSFLKVEHRFRRSIRLEQQIPGEFGCGNDGIWWLETGR